MGKILNTSSLTASYTLPDMSKQEITVKSNTTSTENMTTSFEKVRSSAKPFAIPGESVLQTLTLTNNSDYEISQINITDTLSLGASVVGGSVSIDDTPYDQYSPTTGFTLPKNIGKGESVKVTYNIQVDSPSQTDLVSLFSTIGYTVEGEMFEERTPTVEISIEVADISITKSADKKVAVVGDTITFTNLIQNKGNVEATDIIFTDTLPAGANFVEGSLMIDGVPDEDADPTMGVSLANLNVGGEVRVTFEVKVS